MTTNAEIAIDSVQAGAPDLVARAEAAGFRPLWTRPEQPAEPEALLRPFCWSYAKARKLLFEAGGDLDVGGAGGIDRRVLTMANPSLPNAATTRTLTAALQLVHPGEAAPSHRHSPAALRFVVEGEGASTVVDGLEVPMRPGDLVLTPSWSWHGHLHNEGATTIWLDVLDAPLVRALDLGFYEEFASPKALQPIERPAGSVAVSAEPADLLPTAAYGGTPERPPILRFGSEMTNALLSGEGGPVREVRFVDPATGGPVMTTIDAGMVRIAPGGATPRRKDTANRVFHVAAGAGHSVVDGERLDWGFGDTFCVPTWCEEEHFAGTGGEALLFVASDEPAQRALLLYRAAKLGS